MKAVEPPPVTVIDEGVDAFEDQSSSSVCGAGEEIISTNCLGDTSLVKSQARATARMMMGGCCTAWLVKAATANRGALMLSTGHCGSAQTAQFNFDYVQAACGKPAPSMMTCSGTKLSVDSARDEHAIYELVKPCVPADAATPILLDIGVPAIGEGMYLLGHPNCRPSLLSHQEVHDKGHHCEVRSVSTWGTGSQRISYYCDTQGGNSGSPVFSARTGHAFAIHSHGGCSGNKNSANWGGLLKNPGNVAAFNTYGIPYVDRASTDIYKYETFVKKTTCFDHAGSATLTGKTLAQCKQLCVNSLTCVSIEYTQSSQTCVVNYRSQNIPVTCAGGEEIWERVSTLTSVLQHWVPPTTTTIPPYTGPWTDGKCGFENMNAGDCRKWKNDPSGPNDQFDWTRKSGGTPSYNTGPSRAKEGSFYYYIEASSPRRTGDKAILRSHDIAMGSTGKLEFYYHMFVGGAGHSLEVQVVDGSQTKSEWKQDTTKQQSNSAAFELATVPLGKYAGKTIQVLFIGKRGNHWMGDIAIDDVTLTAGSTATPPPPTLAPTQPPTTLSPTTMPPPTTLAPTSPPTMAPPTQPPTTMAPPNPTTAPPSDLATKLDSIEKTTVEIIALLRKLLQGSQN